MHEVSLVRSIIGTLEAEFSKYELDQLSAIDLKVGLLSNVEPLLLQNAFAAVVEIEEKFVGVKLNVEIIAIEIYCQACEKNTLVENYRFRCQYCGKPNNNVVKGTELLIHQIHFHDD